MSEVTTVNKMFLVLNPVAGNSALPKPGTFLKEVHFEQVAAGDEDLLDLAAIQTLLHDGPVYAVEPEQVPGDGPLAALFRY